MHLKSRYNIEIVFYLSEIEIYFSLFERGYQSTATCVSDIKEDPLENNLKPRNQGFTIIANFDSDYIDNIFILKKSIGFLVYCKCALVFQL